MAAEPEQYVVLYSLWVRIYVCIYSICEEGREGRKIYCKRGKVNEKWRGMKRKGGCMDIYTKLGCATSVVLCTGIIILIFTLFLFTAPEVLRGEDYNHSVDWWSLGIIVYSLLTGQVSRIQTHHFCRIYINT